MKHYRLDWANLVVSNSPEKIGFYRDLLYFTTKSAGIVNRKLKIKPKRILGQDKCGL